MKKLLGVISQIGFYIFVFVIGAFTVSLTLSELREILPGDEITPYFALALFDGGALAWLGAWLFHAKGLYQRALAVIMLIADLAGVVMIAGARLLSGGQNLTDPPAWLGAAIIYGVLLWTALNLIAIYAFHVTEPETMQQIEMQVLEDTIQQEAIEQARANVESEVQALAGVIAARVTGRMKYKLRLPVSDHETQALQGEIIDPQQDPALSAPAQQQAPQILQAKRKQPKQPNPIGLWIAKAAAAARAKLAPQPASVIYEQTTQAPQVIEPVQQPAQQQPQPEPLQVIEPANPTQPATGQPSNSDPMKEN